MNGFNPLRWDCDRSGCYNKKLRPKIELFAEDFPGRIAFSDVDAAVEIGGRFLFLEWKSPGARLQTAQEIFHKNLTRLSPRITSVVVVGDPATMVCESIRVIRNGIIGASEACTLASLKERIRRWANAARARRAA